MCGARPNLRIFRVQVIAHKRLRDDEIVATWQCQGCGHVHYLPAGAFSKARPERRVS